MRYRRSCDEPRWPGAERYRAAVAGLFLLGCSFDKADRWLQLGVTETAPDCEAGAQRCVSNALEECVVEDSAEWVEIEDCDERVCSSDLGRCVLCEPGERRCDEQTPEVCSDDGESWTEEPECRSEAGFACRSGLCQNLCQQAQVRRSNVGCEYWAVDLDNAYLGSASNAAEQQFAVVVSNPNPDVVASVTIEQDESLPGDENQPEVLIEQSVRPLGLEVFPLGPREVDGSPIGQYNTGGHSALSRRAFRLRSSVPVVAYQFNPLDNSTEVFSNDASLLKPVEALSDGSGDLTEAYVALGWPQTIANTDDPNTNFSNAETALRSYLAIVGTRAQTTVRVTPTTATLGAEAVAAGVPGEPLEVQLNPFDVLNLETDGFNADLTGTIIAADAPVVVFSGSEGSDVPFFDDLSERRCCADHLEEQLDHIRTAGTRFVGAVGFNRSLAVANAGGGIGVVPMSEVFRVVSVGQDPVQVTTTLDGAERSFELAERGDFHQFESSRDFILESDGPVMLGNYSPSQAAAGVPRTLPGGDPSFLTIPPVEQFRSDYVFLTPDSYAFDFIRVIATPDAAVSLDGEPLGNLPGCSRDNPEGLVQTLSSEDQELFVVYRCQLSFPQIDPSADSSEGLVQPGLQNDGVHELRADQDVGVLVDGFDRNVSYAYAAGTELMQLVAR